MKVLSIEIGARPPLGVGVSGLVLPAALPRAEAVEIVRRNARRLKALQVDPNELLARAAKTRDLGYAYAPVGVVPDRALSPYRSVSLTGARSRGWPWRRSPSACRKNAFQAWSRRCRNARP